jgi:Leucine-rich repeat (LRR) protein
MKELAALKNLTSLDLTYTKVTDAAAGELPALNSQHGPLWLPR